MKPTRVAPVILVILFFFVATSRLFILTDSRIIQDKSPWESALARKSPELKTLVSGLQKGELPDWARHNAPVLWWHSREKFKASDPLETLARAELWYREVNPFFPLWNLTEARVGTGLGIGLGAGFEGQSPAHAVSRLFERGGLKEGAAGFELRYDVTPAPRSPAPLFWRLGLSPLVKEIQDDNPGHALVPVEYWYFMANNPVDIYFGTHAGDWESSMIVYDVKSKTDAEPLLVWTSHHGGGEWHCPRDLEYKDGRPQFYSGLGTHATYASPGIHWRVYPDRTEAGEAWDGSENMRALVKESWYGFAGSWGATSFVHWMNAPLPPGPTFKYLPAGPDDQVVRNWQEKLQDCSSKETK